MKSLEQLYRLRTSKRSLNIAGPSFVPPHWYPLGFLIRKMAKKRGFTFPFDQRPATC